MITNSQRNKTRVRPRKKMIMIMAMKQTFILVCLLIINLALGHKLHGRRKMEEYGQDAGNAIFTLLTPTAKQLEEEKEYHNLGSITLELIIWKLTVAQHKRITPIMCKKGIHCCAFLLIWTLGDSNQSASIFLKINTSKNEKSEKLIELNFKGLIESSSHITSC